jgi:hypothetical protein
MKKSITMCAAAGIFIFLGAGQIFAQAGSGPGGSAAAPGATSSEEISPGAVSESGSAVTPGGEASPGTSPSGSGTNEDPSDSTGCVQ